MSQDPVSDFSDPKQGQQFPGDAPESQQIPAEETPSHGSPDQAGDDFDASMADMSGIVMTDQAADQESDGADECHDAASVLAGDVDQLDLEAVDHGIPDSDRTLFPPGFDNLEFRAAADCDNAGYGGLDIGLGLEEGNDDEGPRTTSKPTMTMRRPLSLDLLTTCLRLRCQDPEEPGLICHRPSHTKDNDPTF
ncbi:hypothetical protein ACJ41O_011735 [Fusarium nematophilum]